MLTQHFGHYLALACNSCWEENRFMMNGLRRENDQFDIGLILHEKMTHPIITNYQFYHNRIFDPTFLTFEIEIISYAVRKYEFVLNIFV